MSKEKIASLIHSLGEDPENIETIGDLFPKKFVTTIASKPGLGKTLLVQKIMCDLSTGANMCDIFPLQRPYKSLYLSGEAGINTLLLRQKEFGWTFNNENIIMLSQQEFLREKSNLFLDDVEGKRNLYTIFNDIQPDIIFFDTVISFHQRDENLSKDMIPIFQTLAAIANLYNCAVVTIHHTRKTGQRDKPEISQDAVIGSSAGNRLAANVFIIYEKMPGAEIQENVVQCVKSWNKKVPPFGYTIKESKIIFKEDIEIMWTLKYKLDRYIESLKEEEFIDISAAAKAVGTSRAYLTSLLQKHSKIRYIYDNHKEQFFKV